MVYVWGTVRANCCTHNMFTTPKDYISRIWKDLSSWIFFLTRATRDWIECFDRKSYSKFQLFFCFFFFLFSCFFLLFLLLFFLFFSLSLFPFLSFSLAFKFFFSFLFLFSLWQGRPETFSFFSCSFYIFIFLFSLWRGRSETEWNDLTEKSKFQLFSTLASIFEMKFLHMMMIWSHDGMIIFKIEIYIIQEI